MRAGSSAADGAGGTVVDPPTEPPSSGHPALALPLLSKGCVRPGWISSLGLIGEDQQARGQAEPGPG